MRFTKKVAALILTLAMVLTFIPAIVLANYTITVTIDGQNVTFADQQPVIINNRTLVPVGGVFEALGFTPSWSGRAQTATLTRDDFTIVITIGESVFTTNGVEHTLDVPAQIINNRTMLPLRAVLESIGIAPDNIGWDGNARAITIVTGAEVTPPVNPAEAEAQLAAFLSGMDMSAIRDALGVNFTVGITEYIIDLDRNAVQSYRILHLDRELDIDVSTTLEGSRTWTTMFNTQTGDVTLHRLVVEHATTPVARYLVRVDIGSALEITAVTGWQLEDWVDETHRVHHFILVADLYQSVDVEAELAAFIDGMNMDSIRDALSIDFTVGMTEYAWDNDGIHSHRFIYPSRTINTNQLEINNVLTIDTQTGDVILHRMYDAGNVNIPRRYSLRIDIGNAIEVFNAPGGPHPWFASQNIDLSVLTENCRAFHIVFWTDM